MKIVGFTFVRNAVQFDYPVVASIQSLLPICDEVIVAVGNSSDATMELIQSIGNNKIRIVQTVWDDSLRSGGRVLAVETDKALAAVPKDADWAFYLQADEVLHEKDYETLLAAMKTYQKVEKVDGLLLNYFHFYGSYDYIGDSWNWYRREIRVIKPNRKIYSYKDAQGFRKDNNKKLNVKLVNAHIYHYGWVKPPEAQQRKQKSFHKLWHNDDWVKAYVGNKETFDYSQIDALRKFEGTHPKTMQERIAAKNWQFEYDLSFNRFSWKEKCKRLIAKLTGYRVGEYKNYKLL
jgi:glycosyltransferase involved in cell wall biosynthesis